MSDYGRVVGAIITLFILAVVAQVSIAILDPLMEMCPDDTAAEACHSIAQGSGTALSMAVGPAEIAFLTLTVVAAAVGVRIRAH